MSDLIRRPGDLFNDGLSGGWFYKEVVGDGLTSDPVYIPPSGRGITNGTVQLLCGANSGKIQAYFGLIDDIASATADEWQDWQKFTDGETTGTIVDVFEGPLTALRCVSISGEVTFSILI